MYYLLQTVSQSAAIVRTNTLDGRPEFQHAAVQRQTQILLGRDVVFDEEHDAVLVRGFDLELDAELLHVELGRGHGQERTLAQKPDVRQPLVPVAKLAGTAGRAIALVPGADRNARRSVRTVVTVRVARVVPVRAHRTEPAVVAHAPVCNTSFHYKRYIVYIYIQNKISIKIKTQILK